MSSFKSLTAALTLTLVVYGHAQAQTCPDPATLTEGLVGTPAHVRYLADDRLEGRAVGSDGARCAADYLAAQFSAIGLEAAGSQGNYFQPFPIRFGSRPNFMCAGGDLNAHYRPLVEAACVSLWPQCVDEAPTTRMRR